MVRHLAHEDEPHSEVEEVLPPQPAPSNNHQEETHASLPYHPTRFDDQFGPTGNFFLHYYPLLLTIAALGLFVVLQYRERMKAK
jgi:hypothetical protein